MTVIAFDFDRTKLAAGHQQRRGVSAKRECRGIEHGTPWNQSFRLAHIRNDRLKRLPRARRHAGKRHGRTHQLEEAAPRDRIQPFRRTFRKFAVHHFLEFRAACEFFETAPEFRAVLLLDFGRRGSKVDLVLFAGANFLALGLAVLWIAIHFFGRPYGTFTKLRIFFPAARTAG